jgi:hypothetical protein
MAGTFFWTFAKVEALLETVESLSDQDVTKLVKSTTLATIKVALNQCAAFSSNSISADSTLKTALNNILALGKSLSEVGRKVFQYL